jgi:hypothetical protein
VPVAETQRRLASRWVLRRTCARVLPELCFGNARPSLRLCTETRNLALNVADRVRVVLRGRQRTSASHIARKGAGVIRPESPTSVGARANSPIPAGAGASPAATSASDRTTGPSRAGPGGGESHGHRHIERASAPILERPHGGATVSRRSSAPSPPAREHYIGSRCPRCGEQTLVVPCARPGCERWTVVCWGCPGVGDAFIDAEGQCEACRGDATASR